MASKKSLAQLKQTRAVYFDEDMQSYRPSPGYVIMDAEEDDTWVMQYINYDHDDDAWRVEFRNGLDYGRLKETKAAFRLYKQI